MYRISKADKDAYITDKIVRSIRKKESNVGSAGTLDLFKLYGVTFSGSMPNVELSRILVHFDLDPLKRLVESNLIDPSDDSFWCKIRLKDVYGGQPTPVRFNVEVFPLSGTFDEGIGRDVTYYSDSDRCNWISSSIDLPWFSEGCSKECNAQLGGGDYITSSISIANTRCTQYFSTGEEDLFVDVTPIVSATLSGEIPDAGFRVSFSTNEELDHYTYFVKRFGSRTVYDESKRPSLIFGFDDSVRDDSQNLTLDSNCDVFIRNYSGGRLTNMISGSLLSQVTGSNCLTLRLNFPISSGTYDLYFTGSQFSYGTSKNCFVSGTYYSTILLSSSDITLNEHLVASSSIKMTPYWTSLDGTLTYHTGNILTVKKPLRTSTVIPNELTVNVLRVKNEYNTSEDSIIRVNIFDRTSPLIKVVKVPVELPGIVVSGAWYQVRDAVTDAIIIPHDSPKNSTRISSDADGMFFNFYMGSLPPGRTYIFDVAIDQNGTKSIYRDVSPMFKVIQ